MRRDFSLLHKLGEGAYGAVHLAEVRGDEGFVQTVAVKWLHARWSADPELAGRLRDEARLLGLLNHDHIVRVHGLTRLEDRLAVLMEPVDGADLSRAGGLRLPPRAALEITAAVADALDAAWRQVPAGSSQPLRVVHRDIKPSNIMVTTRGGVKVMDFGVARATFDAREADTRSQQFGTARYMAPERWLEGVAEAPSDVFSLGVTLWELLTGSAMERPRLSRGSFQADLDEALAPLADQPLIQELLRDLLAFDPDARPAAEEIARRALAMVDEVPGPGLRSWARDWVPRHQRHHRPDSDGAVIREDPGGLTFDSSTAQVPPTVNADPLVPATAAASLPPAPARNEDTTGTFDEASLVASRRRGVALGVGASLVVAALLLVGGALLTGLGTTPPTGPSEPTPESVTTTAPQTPEPEPEPPTSDNTPAPVVVTEPPAPIEPTAERAPPQRREPPPKPLRRGPPQAPPEVPASDDEAEAEAVDDAPPPTTFVTFMPTTSEVRISGPEGPIPSHRAVALPRSVVPIQVAAGDVQFSCSVLVGASPMSFRIDPATGSCTRAQ